MCWKLLITLKLPAKVIVNVVCFQTKHYFVQLYLQKLTMKRSLFPAFVAAFFGLAIVWMSCKSTQPVTTGVFAFNFQKGTGYNYEMVWDMDQQVMGQENKISVLGNYSIAVTEEKGDLKTLEVTFQRFVMDMSMMGMDMNIDTDKPVTLEEEVDFREDPSGIMAKMFGAIKGKIFRLTVNKEGDITEVTGFDAIVNSMMDSLTIPDEAKSQMRVVASQQFNEQSIKDQFAHAFFIFPNKKVNVGDSWSKRFQSGGQTPSDYSTVYTVVSIDGDHVNLDTKTIISAVAGSQVDLTGEQSGTLVVDSKSGLVKHAEFTQDIKGEAEGVQVLMKGKGKIKGVAF